MEQNINTNITATADFSSLSTQLHAITSELIKLQTTTAGLNKNLLSQIGVMNRGFAETMRSTGQFSTHFVTLQNDVAKFGQNLDTGRLKLNEYYKVWQSHAKQTSNLISGLAKQQVQMQNAILQPLGKNAQGIMQYNVMVQRGLDETKNKIAIARQEAAIMNKVMQDGATQLINWGKNTQWAGRQLTVGLTVPLAAFGAAASKAFQTADQELTRLTKVYGGLAQVSSAELAKVRKDVTATAKEMASSYGQSFQDTIALAADIAATGKQGNELIASTKETTRLAVLGEVSRQDAMKATLSIQSAFKQNTEQLAQSIDFLNAVENQTSTTLEDLTTAIPKAGPVFKALGGDVKDLSLMLVAMKEGGVNASEGANALKSAMASLVNPTKVATDMFSSFGIDLQGIVKNNAGNVTEMMLQLQAALDNLNPLQKTQAIEQLFGKFQFAKMSALFQNLGKEGSQTLQVLDLMKASTQDLAAISQRELTQMTESASGKYKRALESVKADLASVGEGFLKINTMVLNTIDGIVKFVNHLPGPLKSILTFMGGLTAIAGPLIMLTGVLGNFFGYIIKGVFHLKQLFKGTEGFKLLTPEIIAAEKAGSLIQDTFYSDAKATATFADAVYSLAKSFQYLQKQAMESTIAVSNGISTVAGNTVVPNGIELNGQRIANKNHPLIGKPYSRDMVHLTPTGSKTAEQRAAETIFSTVPGPKPVNIRIGNNPQMYSQGDLPKYPGVSSINNISTGIVAEEAGKWHAMTAAIATQSEAEIAALKAEVKATGTITAELSEAYQAMLPPMLDITKMASQEAAAIVQSLQAGKYTVDQARAKIFELNATVEAMMAETATQIATGLNRPINLTTVPLTNQPVVSAQGKSNMKELFHKTETSNLLDQIAKNLGVKTSGGGYSIETTTPRPKKLNAGGLVYDPIKHGTTVPGPQNINYDIIPAKLEAGGYILNQRATRMNPELAAQAQPLNKGGKVDAILTPGETYFGPEQTQKMFPVLESANRGNKITLRNLGGVVGGLVRGGKARYGDIDTYRKSLQLEERLHASPDWGREFKFRSIMHDSAILQSMGVPPKLALQYAVEDFEKSWQSSFDSQKNDINRKQWKEARKATTLARAKSIKKDFGRSLTSMNRGAGITPSPAILAEIEKNKHVFGADVYEHAMSRLFPNGNYIGHSEHVSPADRKGFTNWGYQAVGNYGQAISGEGFLNLFNNDVTRRTKGAIPNALPITSASARSVINQMERRRGVVFSKALETLAQSGEKSLAFKNFVNMFLNAAADRRSSRIIMQHANAGGLIGGKVRHDKHNYGIMNSNAFMAKNPHIYSKLARGQAQIQHETEMLYKKYADAEGRIWHKPGQQFEAKFPKKGSYYQDMTNDDPAHGLLQIGKYRPEMHVRTQYVAPKVIYSATPGTNYMRQAASPAWDIGDIERRAKSALYKYMMGDYSQIADPAVQMYLSSIRTKRTGTFYRGLNLNNGSLPANIEKMIMSASRLGKWDSLVGQEFIMRRSSWSSNKDTASGFGKIMLNADIKNRNAVAASEIFPDLKFDSPTGPVRVNENEFYMGGKFRIVKAGPKELKLQAVYDAKRENGGAVNAGRPYLVGERGPELFVPRNSGGIIPNNVVGGMVRQGKHNYGFLGQTAGMMAAMYGTNMLGSKIGGGLGNAISTVGNFLPFMMMGNPASRGVKRVLEDRILATGNEKLVGGYAKMVTPIAESSTKAGQLVTKLGTLGRMGPMLARVAGGITPLGLGLTAATVATVAFVKAYKSLQEHHRINAVGFGMTAEAAKKAGLKYKDYASAIKQSIENSQAFVARNKLMYESLEKSNTPLNLTIAEFNKLKKTVKDTYGDQVKAINQADNKDAAIKLAVRLKEQLVAGGMAAEDATKKIYTMFQLSNKAQYSIDATTGNRAFGAIKDAKTAAPAAIKDYDWVTKNQKTDGMAQAAQFNTAMQAIDSAIQQRVRDSEAAARKDLTHKKQALTYEQAEAQQLTEINKLSASRAKISETTIRQLEKTNPLIRQMVNYSDTLVSVWQKMRIQSMGFVGDLSKLSATDTSNLLKVATAIQSTVESTNKNGILKSQYDLYNKLIGQQKALEKAAIGQSVQQQINTRDQLKALQKQIDANNKLADSRLKALDAAKQDADLANQIAKKQAEYQAALATGDTASAQQASLDVKALQSQQQYNAQAKAIQNARDAANKPLQDKIDAINAGQQKLSDQAALASEKLSKVTKAAADQKSKIDAVNSAMSALELNARTAGQSISDYAKTDLGKGLAAAVVSAAKAAGIAVPTTDSKGNKLKVPGQATAILNNSGVDTNVNSAITALGGGATLKNVVEAITGKPFKSNSGSLTTLNNAKEKEIKTSEAKTLLDAAKLAQSGKAQTSRFFDDARNIAYDIFKYKGKDYAAPTGSTGEVYLWDPLKQQIGKRVKAAATGVMGGSGMFLVGERGPELINLGSRADIIPNEFLSRIKSASPRYNVPVNSFGVTSSHTSGGPMNITIQNNITAGPDMNMDQLVRKTTDATMAAFKQITQNNAKMVGPGRNVTVR